ncbi:colicin import membrane protein [Streptomyces luteogriseus]|uniref:Colicin import membrane protein n=1 Tax=Streptomyces luteogriseus TaxID=68233 RepID=A0A7W7DKW0_9ACTN|nr:hypothetical protein [Streptomyces luteogriseus]MBB4711162.1 colicin import membrane protein [Streptomyces luteogriseus]
MRITEQQVVQAESRAVEQEGLRDAAAEALGANPYSDMAALRLTEVSQLAAQLRANARELRAAYTAQVEEERRRASRPVLEKAAAAEIGAAGVEMAERERDLVGALEGAQAALVQLVAATAAWNVAVEAHADVLGGAGLDIRGGDAGGDRTALGQARLKLDGRVLEPVNEGAVAAWVTRRVVESRVSERHHLLGALMGAAIAVEQGVPGVVAKVSAPDRVKAPARLQLADVLRGSK